MDRRCEREALIGILQRAYSGELAAGLAYRGHWKSVSDPVERAAIQKIEAEEWAHRRRVGEMLASLNAEPRRYLEAKLWMIGRTIGLACHVIGWFLPMYFAGRLENGNVIEYEEAAVHAAASGLSEFEDDLRGMSRVEKEHEVFFLSVIEGHALLPMTSRVFGWGNAGVSETDVPAESVSSEAD